MGSKCSAGWGGLAVICLTWRSPSLSLRVAGRTKASVSTHSVLALALGFAFAGQPRRLSLRDVAFLRRQDGFATFRRNNHHKKKCVPGFFYSQFC